jgi:hypothetical protein
MILEVARIITKMRPCAFILFYCRIGSLKAACLFLQVNYDQSLSIAQVEKQGYSASGNFVCTSKRRGSKAFIV